MRKLIWIGAALICAVAAVSAWWAFQRPDFMVGFIAASVASIYQALSPALLKRMSPQDEAEWRELQLRGASKEEIREWQKMRRRRNKLK